MIWTVELAAHLDEAPFPATKDELLEWAEREGMPQQLIENLEELDEEDTEIAYDCVEDIWPDYIGKEDFFHNEDEDGFDYDDV